MAEMRHSFLLYISVLLFQSMDMGCFGHTRDFV